MNDEDSSSHVKILFSVNWLKLVGKIAFLKMRQSNYYVCLHLSVWHWFGFLLP